MGGIDPTAWVAPSAVVTGDVTIGARSRVLHGAVLNGDLGPVAIGADVLVMEQSLLRGRSGHPLRVGDAVLIGLSPDRHDELWAVQEPLNFPGTVYGAPRGTPMRELMRRQCARYGPGPG